MSIQDITNELEKRTTSDGTVDRIQLIQQVTDITRITGFLYSLLSSIILVVVPLIVSLEITYMCFPLLREGLERLSIKFEKITMANRVLGVCLRDAREAVTRANTVQTGRSALFIYAGIKLKSLMIVMFVVCLVLKGGPDIINFVMSLIGSVIDYIF